MIPFRVAFERGTVETLDGRDARSRYLTIQLGRVQVMFVVGRA